MTTAQIPLGHGRYAIVDLADLPLVQGHRWYALNPAGKKPNHVGKWYAYTSVKDPVTGKRKIVYMHRMILGDEAGERVDHRDGDGLNNRRHNLRNATNRENAANAGVSNRVGKSSRFKGVHIDRRTKKWRAVITVNHKNIYLGMYDNEEHAALAYDAAALKHYGEFAKTNEELGLYGWQQAKAA